MPDPNGTPRSSVVLLHGFTQTGACLGPLADALATDHAVVRPDLPGHGGATALADKDLEATASHLVAAIGPTLDGPAVWFGYSMGGRVALHVASSHPGAVSGLVLVGATAGIVDDDERSARRASDDELARHITEVGVDRFLDEWLSMPMFSELPEWARFAAERRRNTADGLAGSLRHAGTGTMAPLWDRLGGIDVPVLLVAGERDTKFRGLAEQMAERLPDATVAVVPRSGHAVHLEQPDAVADVVVPFCARLAPIGTSRHGDPGPRWYGAGS